jgi:hypothetical protein
MYSRNLDKALKSILSENPKLRGTREETSEETNSVQRLVSTASVSSHSNNSRETTPSTLGGGSGGSGEIPEFITFYQRQREAGKVKLEVREEAMKVLREWRQEWMVEDKRVRELKRKIKNYIAVPQQVDVPASAPTTTTTTDGKSRGGRTTGTSRSSPTAITGKGMETPTGIVEGNEKSRSESPSRSRSMGGRRESITGPNGLTGSYWDIPVDEMGRGSRRKTKA